MAACEHCGASYQSRADAIAPAGVCGRPDTGCRKERNRRRGLAEARALAAPQKPGEYRTILAREMAAIRAEAAAQRADTHGADGAA
jgi:hypothetical protein